jgi:RNA polymerase sigma-70 factor (ECF subfamily)
MDSLAAARGCAGEPLESLSDGDLVARIRAGDGGAFEILMRRHNQRLYRAARAIVQDESETEDILQQAYLNAFTHLDQFEARSQISTWLTRIVINEASARRRALALPQRQSDAGNEPGSAVDAAASSLPSPEHQAYACELQRLIADAVDRLPEPYRLVFMLRDVEGLSTTECGGVLGLRDDAVKTRLHRARAMIRQHVTERCGAAAATSFQFQAPRCDRVVRFVLGRWPGASGLRR